MVRNIGEFDGELAIPKFECYIMEFTCKICGTKHLAEVPKGKQPYGYNKECPYCGWTDKNNFTCQKPLELKIE